MFFDLNVPLPPSFLPSSQAQTTSKKGKQKQQPNTILHTPAQINTLEARVDLLVHLGYTVIALTQTVHKKVDAKSHSNILNDILPRLRKRPGIIILKRLNIILDEDSEKGFGLINANLALFNSYDLLSLTPTTQATLSLACLSHSLPSPLTAHIISLPLTLPRLPFQLKHTLIRTAIRNGAVFEINYVGALGGENDPVLADAGAADNGANAKRNWWAAARELGRVTKGKGLITSGGVVAEADTRAPRDVGNLIALLGLAQNLAHDSLTKVPKSIVLRAQTRMTYRAVLSEPRLVVPGNLLPPPEISMSVSATATGSESPTAPTETPPAPVVTPETATSTPAKRPREVDDVEGPAGGTEAVGEGASQQKKRKKSKKGQAGVAGG